MGGAVSSARSFGVMATPQSNQRLTIDGYYQHYFSGNQCRVYFDGEYVDEALYVEYSISTNKAPIYSYNDPYFKMVATGNYLVQGNIHINMTDRNRLIRVGNKMSSRKQPPPSTNIDVRALKGDQSIMKYMTVATEYDRKAIIDKYIEQYWGDLKPKSQMRPYKWDLNDDGDIDLAGFEIVMLFGVPGTAENMFTIKQINDVHITGEALVVQEGGGNVIEQYPFFARNIDENIAPYYSGEDVYDMQEPMDVEKDLTNTVIMATIDMAWWSGGYWAVRFKFDTRDPNIVIRKIDQTSSALIGGNFSEVTSDNSAVLMSTDNIPNAAYIEITSIPASCSFVEADVSNIIVSNIGSDIEYSTNAIDATKISGNPGRIIAQGPGGRKREIPLQHLQ